MGYHCSRQKYFSLPATLIREKAKEVSVALDYVDFSGVDKFERRYNIVQMSVCGEIAFRFAVH